MGETEFFYSDLYPGMSNFDTSTNAQPEKDDQDALNQESEIAEKASKTQAGKKPIFLTLLVIVGLIVFLGGDL